MAKQIQWKCDRCTHTTTRGPRDHYPLNTLDLPEHGQLDVCDICADSIQAAIDDVLDGELGYE